jgi:MFS family permease
VQSIAGSAGALLGGYLFTLAGFYLVAYALAGAYAVAFLITLFLPNDESNSKVEGDVKLQTQTYSIFALLKVLLTKPSLRFYLASNIATAPNWGVKPFLWPLVIFAISGSDVITGSIFATMGLVAFMLLPFAGMVADKVGPYRVIVVELFLFSVTGITMALTGTIAVFWVAAAVYTIAEVFNLAQAMILTEELDENIRSQAMALDTAFDQIIGFISPLLAGVLVTLYSPSVALLFFMSLYVFGFVATLSLFRKHQFGVRC